MSIKERAKDIVRGCWRESSNTIVESLESAGLLREEADAEVRARYTPRLLSLLLNPAGLLGQRIGVAADFAPHPDLLVTDLHKRALETCERFAKAWDAAPEYYYDNSTDGPITRDALDIGRESLAAKEAAKPKPRWTVRHQHNVSWVDDRGTSSTGPWTEDQAKAIARVLNELEAAK